MSRPQAGRGVEIEGASGGQGDYYTPLNPGSMQYECVYSEIIIEIPQVEGEKRHPKGRAAQGAEIEGAGSGQGGYASLNPSSLHNESVYSLLVK